MKRSCTGCLVRLVVVASITVAVCAAASFCQALVAAGAEPNPGLVELAERHFGDISDPERRLFEAIASGQVAEFPDGLKVGSRPDALVFNTDASVIRASRIAWLVSQPDAQNWVTPRGIQVSGARIIGTLDLAFASTPYPLVFTSCYFDDPMLMQGATLSFVRLGCSRIEAIFGDGVSVSGSFEISDGSLVRGPVHLAASSFGLEFACLGSDIGAGEYGGLILEDAEASRITIRGGNSFSAPIQLSDARVVGSVLIEDTRITVHSGDAIVGRNLRVGTDLVLDNVEASGPLVLIGADVEGTLYVCNSTLSSKSGMAIDARFAHLGGMLQLGPELNCSGGIALTGAVVGGINCVNTLISSSPEPAMTCGSARIEGSVIFSGSSKIEGRTDFINANIEGDLACSDVEFANPSEQALVLDQAEIRGSVAFSPDSAVVGQLSLVAATISNALILEGRHINPGGEAIISTDLVVGGSLHIGATFRPLGCVSLSGIRVSGHLVLEDVESTEDYTLDLRHSSVGMLADRVGAWPSDGHLYIEGFTYETIYAGSPVDIGWRLRWIEKQPGGSYGSQPFEQLASALDRMGDREGARAVLYEKARREGKSLHPLLRLLREVLFGLLLGYGYYPLRLVWVALSLNVASTAIFAWAKRHEILVLQSGVGSALPLNPAMYSLDLFIPIVDFHQTRYWIPVVAERRRYPLLKLSVPGWLAGRFIRCWYWFMIAAGWVVTTLVVLTFAGLVQG